MQRCEHHLFPCRLTWGVGNLRTNLFLGFGRLPGKGHLIGQNSADGVMSPRETRLGQLIPPVWFGRISLPGSTAPQLGSCALSGKVPGNPNCGKLRHTSQHKMNHRQAPYCPRTWKPPSAAPSSWALPFSLFVGISQPRQQTSANLSFPTVDLV